MAKHKLGFLLCKSIARRKANLMECHIYNTRIRTRCMSDEAKSGAIVVEKEKKEKSWKLAEFPWSAIPLKVAQTEEYFREIARHPYEQRARGRMFRDDEILFHFRDEGDLNNWVVVTDEQFGGKSWAEFVLGENGVSASFRGFISQRLPNYMLPSTYDKLEDKPYFQGFANLETKPFVSGFNQEDRLNLGCFNAIDIRIRGDGRKYLFEMLVDNGVNDYMQGIPVHTKGGPEWETVRVSSLRLLLIDGIEGPFQLEIDYIGLVKDHTESRDCTEYHDPNSQLNSSIGTW